MRRASGVSFIVMALACTWAAEAGNPSRPFEASLVGNANPVPTEDPCVLINTETGSGQARHLGRFTWASVETVHVCSDPAQIEGEFVMTAANGDQVFGVYQTQAEFDFGTNTIAAFGDYEITGGTGRFQGAQGGGTLFAMGSLVPPFPFEGGLSGWISY